MCQTPKMVNRWFFKELRNSMERFFGASEHVLTEQDQANLRRNRSEANEKVRNLFNEVVGQTHRVETAQARVKADNTTYVGCFSEDELPANRSVVPDVTRYLTMRESAPKHLLSVGSTGVGTKYFAMAVSWAGAVPESRVVAFDSSPHMPPRHGTGSCGHYCADEENDRKHWCGCAPRSGETLESCPGQGRRFAVHALPQEDGSPAQLPRSRPVWHLGEDADGGKTLEVHAPPGRKLKQDAGHLLVVRGDASKEDAPEDSSEDSVAHVGVPVDLSKHDCTYSDGGSKMKCKLHDDHVKEVKVRYVPDEL